MLSKYALLEKMGDIIPPNNNNNNNKLLKLAE